MPIVTSVIAWDQPQADGRRWVRETHTDHLGLVMVRDFVVAAGVNTATDLAAHAADLTVQLSEAEIQRDLRRIYQDGDAANVTAQYATLAQIRQALRDAYQTTTRQEAVALGAFLNTLTNVQLGTIFGVSGAALTALKTRLQTKATQWTDFSAAAGE